LPNKSQGVAQTDHRRVLNAIFYILRTGPPRRELPERYGPYTTALQPLQSVAKAGIWLRVFEVLAAASPQSMQLIDSSIVRPTRMPPVVKRRSDHTIGGRSRGGLTSKIHVVISMSRGCRSVSRLHRDRRPTRPAPGLLEGLLPAPVVVPDRGYDWQHLIDWVSQRGGQAHIPTRAIESLRSVDPTLYRRHNLVERFSCKLKHFRRTASRYDKLARNFLDAIASRVRAAADPRRWRICLGISTYDELGTCLPASFNGPHREQKRALPGGIAYRR
jgi:transposase